MPLIPGQQLIVGSPDAIRNNLRRAVIDVRRAVDWLATRDDIDQGAISIAGVSLGGIVASLAFKVEPRFANAVLVVAGSGGLEAYLRTGGYECPRCLPRSHLGKHGKPPR